jgi:peptide/nickel transport system substrate-binding protein
MFLLRNKPEQIEIISPRRVGMGLRRVRLGTLAITAVVALALGACDDGESSDDRGASGSPASGVPETSSQSTLRVGLPQGLDSTNPLVATSSDFMMAALYPKLFQYSGDTKKLVPDFATEWETSSDGKTFTAHTVPGAKWSDGRPLTARDAAFTFNTMLKYEEIGAAGVYGGGLQGIESARATDDNTLVVTYSEAMAPGVVEDGLSIVPVLPEHIWSSHTGNGGKDLTTFKNFPPVTGGAFTLRSFEKNSVAVMERNDDFYGDKPKVEVFGLKVYTSTDALVAAVKSGEVDVATRLEPSTIPALKASPNLAVTLGPAFREDYLLLNTDPKRKEHHSLLDPKVREAIDLAIDRQNVVDVLFRGAATPSNGVLPPTIGDWHNPDIEPQFDPEAAASTLEAAGYEEGSDGIRAKGDDKLSYKLLLDSSVANASRMADLVKADLDEVGIELIPQSIDLNAAFGLVTTEGSDDWDMMFLDGSFSIDPDLQLQAFTCEGGLAAYCDERFDELYRQQRQERDPAKRVDLVHQAEKMIADDRTWTTLDFRSIVTAADEKWHGIVTMPDSAVSYFGNLTELQAAKE